MIKKWLKIMDKVLFSEIHDKQVAQYVWASTTILGVLGLLSTRSS